MAGKLPKDCSARAICTRSRGIFAYQLDAERWEWHEQTGTDHGTDIVLELVEDGEFCGKKIEGQLKGRTKIEYLRSGKIRFELEVKTINYALSSSNAFVLFLVDVTGEKTYFLPLQDYFIANPDKIDAAGNNDTTVTVHLNVDDNLVDNGDTLIEIAKSIYAGGPTRTLHKVV